MSAPHHAAPIRVWLVDDSSDPHQVADLTVADLPGFELSHFYSGSEAIAAFARIAGESPELLPAVILMDFFLGDERGDAVTTALRCLEPPQVRPTIVGYSSVRSGSERIIASGGDLVVRKHRGDDGVNPSLRRFLQTVERAR
jgi:CheY-like chemotaxis protein